VLFNCVYLLVEQAGDAGISRVNFELTVSAAARHWPWIAGKEHLAMDIEFTAMEIFHHALRRDLKALEADFDRERWRNFAFQLHFHHASEDLLLWPVVRAKITDSAGSELLDAMEAEHARIDPMLAAAEAELAGGQRPELADLAAAVTGHLDHEEQAALPMMDRVLTQQEWDGFVEGTRKLDGDLAQNPAILIPWMLDGAPEELRRRVLANLPAPVLALISGAGPRPAAAPAG
jgi:Hemerythrin HHE cation binding domain